MFHVQKEIYPSVLQSSSKRALAVVDRCRRSLRDLQRVVALQKRHHQDMLEENTVGAEANQVHGLWNGRECLHVKKAREADDTKY